jgi:O-antigen ligase
MRTARVGFRAGRGGGGIAAGRGRLLAGAAAALAPGVLVVVLSFRSGGFFPGSWSVVAVCAAAALALRVLVAPRPFAGLSVTAQVVTAALALLGAWMLLSAGWSDAPGRALLGFVRLLAYALVFVVLAAFAGTARRSAWTLRGVAVAISAVCVCALITRLAPDVWHVHVNPSAGNRLAYPITYWNGLGLMAAAGLVLALHLTADGTEPWWVRVAGAGLGPPLACTLYFTFSRGAIGATAVGLAVYLVFGRPRCLLTALASSGVATAIALVRAYDAPALSTAGTPPPGAVTAGHHVGVVIILCCAGAMVVRAMLLPVDSLFIRARLPGRARPFAWGLAGAAAVAAVVVLVAAGAPGAISDAAHRFLYAPSQSSGDLRSRLTVISNNGRTDHWRIALDAFRDHPLTGTGQGTYVNEWNRLRPSAGRVLNAHSLFFETLGELGAVGLALLVIALGGIVAGLAWRARGPARGVPAAALAATLTWIAHAAVDWDWQLVAVSIWVFGLAGAVLARPAPAEELAAPAFVARILPRPLRIVIALAALALAIVPFRMAQSEARLEAAVNAFLGGNCPAAVDGSLASLGAVGQRTEPWELIAYCDVRGGRGKLALRAIDQAVALDPDNWELHYAKALVLGAQSRDPRPEARRAHALNPLQSEPQAAVKAFHTKKPRLWNRRARRLPLPIYTAKP